MEEDVRYETLKNANIPSEWMDHCFIADGDVIFTPIFDECGVMVKTGKVNYDEWLANKDKPPIVEPTDAEKISNLFQRITQLESENAELTSLVTTMALM